MVNQRFWTAARRRIVAKTLFDILKIELAAAFASKFFIEFNAPIKALMTLVILATCVGAILCFPPEDGE